MKLNLELKMFEEEFSEDIFDNGKRESFERILRREESDLSDDYYSAENSGIPDYEEDEYDDLNDDEDFSAGSWGEDEDEDDQNLSDYNY
jgi:hypothetical protein